ncbi:MAG: hypothetical protein EOM91_15605 [Sphingobacteriia bacterium]|nr:hypothetical protein [Sphingobacteriia bacterium]NCC39829.1 hypothetical protein [Gammaproteobacteria bacterium]
MNLRSIIGIGALAVLAALQGGCASAPSSQQAVIAPAAFEIGSRPYASFPGGSRAEVKALAMGAAKSRAWTIVESTDDRLVMNRVVDSRSPLGQEIAALGLPSGTLIEVTSHFLNEGGGTTVALDAALVATLAGEPTRTDYTETFRPALTESLNSLRESWTQNRARVARAAPPLGAATASAAQDGAGEDGIAQLDEASERQPAAWTNEAAAAVIAPPATPTAARTPTPAPAVPTTQAVSSAPRPPAPVPAPASPVRLADRPVSTTTPAGVQSRTPAPVVDASPILRREAPAAASQPMTLPAPAPATVPVSAPDPSVGNLVALYPAPPAASWSQHAEQYARLRGCNVTAQGAILIESRTDGEVHRVPCEGSDSVWVQCWNGECRGLL